MILRVNYPPFGGDDTGVNALGRGQHRDKTALPSL